MTRYAPVLPRVQAAADASASGMVSVIGLDSARVQELCDAANEDVPPEERVQIANYLCNVRGTLPTALELQSQAPGTLSVHGWPLLPVSHRPVQFRCGAAPVWETAGPALFLWVPIPLLALWCSQC